MTTVLGIDTAGPVVGACVLGPDIQAEWSERVQRGADTALIPAIADLMSKVDQVDLVSVVVGPGAFTGLRVGVAAALGIAVSRKIPVVCVSSLEARAALVRDGSVVALLDARKSRVYAQWFDCTGDVPSARNVAVDAPMDEVFPAEPFVAIGEGALLEPKKIEAAGGRIHEHADQSAASSVARLGLLRRKDALPPNEVALAYLRDADAKKTAQRLQ